MVALILSIVASIAVFYLTRNPGYFSLILVGLYFAFRKSDRAESLAGLNLLLIGAIAIFGRFRPYSLEGLNFVVCGTFLSIFYDILKTWYSLIPMMLLTGMGIGAIGAHKFGVKGYLLGLILIPVILREYSIQKRYKTDDEDNE
uniref:Glycosyltransferase RgtA/B/C/D-like domain-containing protein n=1 Tax=Fervidobacterium pennivorans TaxID=93466 RepID=A0A7V4NE74_FERPE